MQEVDFLLRRTFCKGHTTIFRPNVWRYIIVIADTLLIIILPAAAAREYECIWYADSFSTSNSSSDSLHINSMS
jgi:hypothetical protein